MTNISGKARFYRIKDFSVTRITEKAVEVNKRDEINAEGKDQFFWIPRSNLRSDDDARLDEMLVLPVATHLHVIDWYARQMGW